MTVRTQSAAHAGSDTGEPERIYRRDELTAVTGYGIDRIYQLVDEGSFPRPIPLGKRAVGWLSSEVREWQLQRIAERDAKAAA